MSGDAGGSLDVLVAGGLVLAAVPVVLTGAAVAGVAYGGIKMAQAALGAAERHRQNMQIQVNDCSTEVQKLYARVQQTVNRMDAENQAVYEQSARSLTAQAQTILEKQKENQKEQQMNFLLTESRKQIQTSVQQNMRASLTEI